MVHFIAHGKDDTVGVAVVDIKAGQQVAGWNMETDQTLGLKAGQDILLGHKIALADVPAGQRIIKYNHPIGRTTRPVKKGEHVHVHNLESERWQR